ncbi:MAG: hypothetical protein ACPGOV_14365 [Magnetovibrionaceae bacterium]
MKQFFFAAMVMITFGICTPAGAKDQAGAYLVHGKTTCTAYLDAYSKAVLTGEEDFDGPKETLAAFSWIDGYLTAYNAAVRNGRFSLLGNMTLNQAREWVANWCQSNSKGKLSSAVKALTRFKDQ